MTDLFLKKIWQDIKDPDWPTVEIWDDFAVLPDRIKEECKIQHSLHDHLEKFHDPDFHYGKISLHDFYQKDQFVFVNVHKCGFQHHRDFFVDRLRWKKKTWEDLREKKDLIFFGLMMHPLRRYIKGVTEFIWSHNLADQINDIDQLLCRLAIPDLHTIPYSMGCRPWFEEIHWIPFSLRTSSEVKKSMNALFKKYSSDLEIPVEHPMMHESGPEKLELYKKIKKSWEKQHGISYLIYYLHARDLKFYQDLVQKFKDDWSHLTI